MVSPSKKKRKVTVLKMNKAISQQSNIINTPLPVVTSPNQQRRSRKSSLSPSFKSKTAAISHPSSSKIHPPLTNASFFSSVRTYTKDGTDMVSELSKNVLNDFDLKYNKSNNYNCERRSIRFIESSNNSLQLQTCNTTSSYNSCKDDTLSSYRRCLLEDFMVLDKHTNILVLVPFKIVCECLLQDSFWSNIDSESFLNYQTVIQFKKKKYHCVLGSIITNPKLESVRSGISQYDLMDGLGTKNSGCLVDFGFDNNNDNILKLITWNMVLKGRVTGLQVWSQRKDIRNLGTAFNNRKKTNIGLVSLLNAMYYEMYGDRLQCMFLVSYFYRTQLKQKYWISNNLHPLK